MDLREFWHKYHQTITSISVIIFIIFAVVMIKQDRALKEEINKNCGWGEEDYQCYCEKSDAMRIKNKMNNNLIIDWEVEDVKLDS